MNVDTDSAVNAAVVKVEIDIDPVALPLPAIHGDIKTETKVEPEDCHEDWIWEGAEEHEKAEVMAGQEVVKQEVDVGPVVLQPPDLAYVKMSPKPEPDENQPNTEGIYQQTESTVCTKKQLTHINDHTDSREKSRHSTVRDKNSPTVSGSCIYVTNGREKSHEHPGFGVKINDDATSLGDLNRYKRSDSDGNCYECPVCNMLYPELLKFRRHLRTHTSERPYDCTECDKKFISSSHLRRHSRTHTGEKPYTCKVCSKSFSQYGTLHKHNATHTGKKPYECTECNKTFAQRSSLRVHIRTHTGEKPYECTECDKKFSKIYGLRVHARTHTGEKPYKCTECYKTFNQISSLSGHMRTHTGEKPYECSECNKRFTQCSALRVHKRSHTGEEPYECATCFKKFAYNSNYYKHMLTHDRKTE